MHRRVCEGYGRATRARVRAALAALLGLGLCGCAGPLLVFRGGEDAAGSPAGPGEGPATTGALPRAPRTFGADLGEEDWRRARAALGVALDPQGNGRPAKWDNPETGLRGAVNPTNLPYVAHDLICRDFLASVVAPGEAASAEAGPGSAGAPGRGRFLRGTACRPSGGPWELTRLRAVRTGPDAGR